MPTLTLPTLSPATAARALPPFETPEWRTNFARGIRAALRAEGRAAYLSAAIAAMRDALGPSEMFEVSAPEQSGNAKLKKNQAVTLAFTGASGADSGRFNPCPAIGDCGKICVIGRTCGLAAAGLADHMIGARSRRLIAMREHPVAAGVELVRAAARAARLADSLGLRTIARLNVGTDIGFESIPEVDSLFARFAINAYAYTKRPAAVRAALGAGGSVGRTRIVYSWSERVNETLAAEYLRAGGTVALVVGGIGRAAPTDRFRAVRIGGQAFPMIDGDATDDRTTDPRGVVVALRGKGPLQSLVGVDAVGGFALRPDDARLIAI
jgi:hypothetical protein